MTVVWLRDSKCHSYREVPARSYMSYSFKILDLKFSCYYSFMLQQQKTAKLVYNFYI